MIQLLQLLGNQPILLELSFNPCVQQCEYCYAKMTYNKNESIDDVCNDIIKKAKKNNLLGSLLREKHPIVVSNRTDIMASKNWKQALDLLHNKLGYPIFLQTKLNKDWREIPDVLDKNRSIIYVTVTGYGNKYEENNLVSNEEKLEALKHFKELGYFTVLAVNPIMPDKVSVDEIIEMLVDVEPTGLVLGVYHRGFWRKYWKFFPPLYEEGYELDYMGVLEDFCNGNGIAITFNDNEEIFKTTLKPKIKEFFGLKSPLFCEAWNRFNDSDKNELTLDEFYDEFLKQDVDEFDKNRNTKAGEIIYGAKKKMGSDGIIPLETFFKYKLKENKFVGITENKRVVKL